MRFTLGDFKLRDGLPFVHGHTPALADTAAAEVDDELIPVAVEVLQYRLQSLQ
jgi:hypothetical protein